MKEKTLRGAMSSIAIGLVTLLSGCSNLDILDPKGSVGVAERDLIATSTWAMLIVVIPVIALTLLFAWRYRASNKSAEYRPNWSHSTGIEIAVWTIPTLIILFLGVLTWTSTHELDPYRPLESSVKRGLRTVFYESNRRCYLPLAIFSARSTSQVLSNTCK